MEVDGGSISALEIWNDSLNRMVYGTAPANAGHGRSSGGRSGAKQGNDASQGGAQQQKDADKQANAEMIDQANKARIDAVKIRVIKDAIQKKGLSEASILGHYKRKDFGVMTVADWTNAMQLLEKYPDKEGGGQ